jgi:hypothetical protein
LYRVLPCPPRFVGSNADTAPLCNVIRRISSSLFDGIDGTFRSRQSAYSRHRRFIWNAGITAANLPSEASLSLTVTLESIECRSREGQKSTSAYTACDVLTAENAKFRRRFTGYSVPPGSYVAFCTTWSVKCSAEHPLDPDPDPPASDDDDDDDVSSFITSSIVLSVKTTMDMGLPVPQRRQ